MNQLALAPSLAFPHRPPLRYFGGKWRAAKWILGNFPRHTHYCTPYGGGWCESFQKTRAGGFEIYNDLNPHNVNFLEQLRDRPDELIPAIEATPRNREEFELSRQSDQGIEAARRYYIYCQLSVMGGGGHLYSGTSAARLDLKAIRDDSHLWAASERLQGVLIEQSDALECIAKYDDPKTLFYADPPYPRQALASGDRKWYLHHMSNEDHRALAALLNQIKGNAIVSGYDCPLYEEIFAGWKCVKLPVVNMQRDKAVECLWIKEVSHG